MTPPDTLIAVADYGMGNLHSVRKALESLGATVAVTDDPAELESAPGFILPGVGAFGDAMQGLQVRGILETARNRAAEAAGGGRPFLGICLGMQVLVDEGEEDPGVRGLGVISGTCPRLVRSTVKIPHMGWNSLAFRQPDNPLFDGLGDSPSVYFVHSYEVRPSDPGDVAAVADYEGEVVASLRRANLFATQFHPEKSQKVGLGILANFIALVRKSA